MIRKPTEQEVAEALRYIEHEFVLKQTDDGFIHLDAEYWVEGLAYGPGRGYEGCPHHFEQAREVMPQLSELDWKALAARADRERTSQNMRPLYTGSGL